MELPKTDAELQALIDQKVEEATKALESKHSGAIASIRKDYDTKLEKFKQQQALSEEERAQALAKEKEEALANELNDLRTFKKSSILKERLTKEGLPTYFANDNRLINAEDGDLDKVIKVVKGEYEANLPKGATHSTVVQTQQGNVNLAKTEKEQAYAAAAEALKKLM